MLELRDVPAILFWTNMASDHDAHNAANWLELVGESQWQTTMVGPQIGDSLVFDGNVTSASADGLQGFDLSQSVPDYLVIALINGYSGTVTLAADSTPGLTTEILLLHGGAISQPGEGTDLTVLTNFCWTAGTLNSSCYLAEVMLDGATATIAPASAGMVTLGSMVNLSGGAIATLREGTLNIINDGVNLNINENCVFLVDPGATKISQVNVNFEPNQVTQINIKEGAWLRVDSGQFYSGIPLKNTGGSLVLENDTVASFSKKVDKQPLAASIVQTSGATYIAADAKLMGPFASGMQMSGGLLSIKTGAKPANFDGNFIGSLEISGGDIAFDTGSGGGWRGWGEFWVAGFVIWTGGTYHPYVSIENDGINADWWNVAGQFYIGQDVTVVPTGIFADGITGSPPSNTEWRLFESEIKIAPAVIGGNDPPAPDGYSFVKIGDPIYKWNLKSN